MHPGALHDLVDDLAFGAQAQSDKLRVIGSVSRKDVSIRGIVAGREHVLDIGGNCHLALDGTLVDGSQNVLVSGKHHHGLNGHWIIDMSGAVTIGFADDCRRLGNDAAGQEGGHVQLLPVFEVIADDEGDLGVEHASKLRPGH